MRRINGAVYYVHNFLRVPHSGNFEVDFFGMKYHGNLGDYIDWNVFYFGAYSPEELAFLSFAAEHLE